MSKQKTGWYREGSLSGRGDTYYAPSGDRWTIRKDGSRRRVEKNGALIGHYPTLKLARVFVEKGISGPCRVRPD